LLHIDLERPVPEIRARTIKIEKAAQNHPTATIELGPDR
jgi:hypothetical protein